jgi:hypothetical protein
LLIAAGILVFLFLLNIMTQSGGELDFMLPFRDERIICGVPTIAEIPINTIDHGNSLEGILYYITHNTQQFIRLGWLQNHCLFWLNKKLLFQYSQFIFGSFLLPILFTLPGIFCQKL